MATVPTGINGVLTPYGTSLLLESLFREQLALPHIWLALLWGPPSGSHDGETMSEVQAAIADPSGSGLEVATGYTRAYYRSVEETGRLRWVQSSNHSVYNVDPVVFPMADADWGYIRGWAMTDAVRAGHVIACGVLDLEVFKGDQVVVNPNNLGLVVVAGG